MLEFKGVKPIHLMRYSIGLSIRKLNYNKTIKEKID